MEKNGKIEKPVAERRRSSKKAGIVSSFSHLHILPDRVTGFRFQFRRGRRSEISAATAAELLVKSIKK